MKYRVDVQLSAAKALKKIPEPDRKRISKIVYELLAIVDAIRDGRARERDIDRFKINHRSICYKPDGF